jgi:Integrase core domain
MMLILEIRAVWQKQLLINKKSEKYLLINKKLARDVQIADEPFSSISMDFITGFPKSINKNDQIFVVVDRFSKRARFIACKKTDTAITISKLFFKYIISQHDFPREIVSDRDAKFTSKFWTELFRATKTKLSMSTAYHPQSDGQTEVVNKFLEEMLHTIFISIKRLGREFGRSRICI